MEVVAFTREHLAEARELALKNYKKEQEVLGSLPRMERVPDLSEFADNGLGVAAFEGERMLGFIGCLRPWEQAFDSEASGTFTPVHAHGCVKENRDKIYQRMYQKMADTLVKKGVLYHAIGLYEHDKDAIYAYFHNGFGHRCSDAIRKMEVLSHIKPVEGIVFEEIVPKKARLVRELRRELSIHMGESSCFMYTAENEFENWVKERENNGNRLFVAKREENPIAFIEISDEGETFVADHDKMQNICGAFCLPEYRGKQIFQNLINYVIKTLSKEGFEYLGVDYESFNPTAFHFWTKYFEPYTCSVTRRIDECVLKR